MLNWSRPEYLRRAITFNHVEQMKNKRLIGLKGAGIVAMLALTSAVPTKCLAGHTMKWEEVPEAVRATVLANGGQVGPMDRESGKIDGKVLFEAVGKDKAGKRVDLVVDEGGKLVMTKDDDAADKAQEQAAHVKKALKALAGLKFNHPGEISNPYLPLSALKQDVLVSKTTRVERTA